MSREALLVVESGPCKGRKYAIESGGSARAGRSSSNNIAINDPSVSRFHCRIFFKPGAGLWIADLGSANQTLVNGKTVQETRLAQGDRITIGDSILAVVADGTTNTAGTFQPQPGQKPAATGDVVDLGLATTEARAKAHTPNLRLILLLLALMFMSTLVVWIFFFRKPVTRRLPGASAVPRLEDFELRYEKVEGSSSNIFQCVLTIRGTNASIEVHDAVDNKNFKKPLAGVDSEVIAELWDSFRTTGILGLRQADYIVNSQNTYELKDLSVMMGTNSYRFRVLNAPEPPEFENARKLLEGFGQNEFGRAWAYPRGELERLAGESMQLGLKLYEEKGVSHGNLYKALRSFDEAVVLLETVDPKPGFYRDLVDTRERCRDELTRVVGDLWFEAERAQKTKDWHEAVNVLRILCDTVPDRLNKDYRNAEQQLTDAERRLKK
ncbi:MAG: FHA domain-containing protein [bacterium]